MHSEHAITGKCANCTLSGPLDFQFTFAFQPIVDAVAETIVSHEALVRGPRGESAAWVLDKVNDANRYRFDQACRVAAIALAARLGMNSKININFMPNAVYQPETCIRSTFAAADRYRFPIDRIVFEVVENDAMPGGGTTRLVEIMREYKRFGFDTALDDFGAGFGNLATLAAFQPDIIKIDMALVRGIAADRPRQAIVHGLLATCAELGIRVLAEGVETLAEYAWLRAAGIELFQGYLLARPAFEALPQVPFAELRENLRAFDIERHAKLVG